MMNLLMRRGALALAVLACAACGDPNANQPAKEGELGVGTFFYRCVGDSDPFCDDGGQAENFPEAIAVGGRFSLDYNQDIDGALPNVTPGSDSIRTDGPGLVIVRAGWAVVLASEGFGDVVDLLHLAGRDVERIAVVTGDSQELETIELGVGERIVLRGRPQDVNRTTLAGSLNYDWVSEDEAVFAVASADLDESVEIEGTAPGSTMLSVTAGSYTQMIAVEVSGTPGTTGDATTDGTSDDGDESDSGSDTGTGSDSASDSGSDSDSGTTGGDESGSGDATGSTTGGTAG
ncbi:MAG: hypothetical protein AAF721_05615 [Myxococcota bacterium]